MTIILRIVTLIVGLALSGPALAGAAEEDLASAKPVIEATNSDWVGAMQAGDAARVVAPYADNGLFILPDGTVLAGRAAIEAFTQKRFVPGTRITEGRIQQDGIGANGDGLVYEWGHGGLTKVDAAGKTTQSWGSYLTVWRRDTSGKWQIIRNLTF